MNSRVKNRLGILKNHTKIIIGQCNMLLQYINEVECEDDLYVIESTFERIERNAETGRLSTQEAYDMFE